MTESRELFELLCRRRLIALLSPRDPKDCLRAYELCEREEVVLEIAFRTAHAEEGIRAVRAAFPDARLLAGTVMTASQARAAMDAGASGIVSADYIPEVVTACVERGVMVIPGGLGDAGKQLVQKAGLLECPLSDLRKEYPEQWIYKLFPAFSGGVSRVGLAGAWRGPYRDLAVVHTGGIDGRTLPAALRADPEGIFCGSELARDSKNPEKMTAEIRKWKSILAQGRPGITPASPKTESGSSAPGTSEAPGRVVCFGEMMLRLSPPVGERLARARTLELEVGGAEANVAVSLARFGREAVFVSALPDNDLGEKGRNVLRGHGVLTDFVVRKGRRMGIYFLEPGSGPRPSRVIYDRSGSAASRLTPADIDWDRALDGAAWFHWTGITPALSDSTAEALRVGLQTARARSIPVSVDLNYRKALWSEEKARAVMSELMPYVDVCIGNEEDPTRIFGIEPRGSDVERGRIDAGGYRALAVSLRERFGFSRVAVTLRESLSASENMWSACLLSGEGFIQSRRYRVFIVDRVGSGDAFAAGLIHALLDKRPDGDALEFGVAAAVLKHSIKGDFNLVDAAEVERIVFEGTSGRIRR